MLKGAKDHNKNLNILTIKILKNKKFGEGKGEVA
jgi:hypothetical protein